ncbi:tetratricopeptide repeat protein [Sorangium sp. So ce124]|uniref:tetratricopeptide repeat protein n=1 Tax=Sorangium sp. So ce124 TaxID=3133280 RepID=UPI003F63939E
MSKAKAMNPPVIPGPLPMRGGLLALLASAFRLRERIQDRPGGMSTTTAKRVLGDEPQVRSEKRAALVRVLLEALFTPDYLAARGLTRKEIYIHNELVAAALEDVLDRWDELARLLNPSALPADSFFFSSLLQSTGLLADVLVRCAAYLVLYRDIHSVLEAIPAWYQQPGLQGVYDDLVRRARRGVPSQERLRRDTRLDKRTLQAIRRGTGELPQGETLVQLASAFATYDVASHTGGRLSAAEIELELRVACAVARVRAHAQTDPSLSVILGEHFAHLRRLRSELRAYTRDELAVIVVRGMRSPYADALRRVAQTHAIESIFSLVMQEEQRAARIHALINTQPEKAMREIAAEMSDMAQRVRRDLEQHEFLETSKVPRLLVRILEQGTALVTELTKSPAERSTATEAAFRSLYESNDELEAESLVLRALAPWEHLTAAAREALLREAVARSPSSVFARGYLADHLVRHGRIDEAIAHLYAILGERPDDHETREHLALLLVEAAPREALAEAEAALEHGGRTAASHYVHGECLIKLNRPSDAEASFQRALKMNPHHSPSLDGLSRCRRALGDEREARRLEQQAAFYGGAAGGFYQSIAHRDHKTPATVSKEGGPS